MSRKWSYPIYAAGGFLGWWQTFSEFELVPRLKFGRYGGMVELVVFLLLLFSFSRVHQDLSASLAALNQKWGEGFRQHTKEATAHEKKMLWVNRVVGGACIGWVLPWLMGAMMSAYG